MEAISNINLINRYNPKKEGLVFNGKVDKNKKPIMVNGLVDRFFCEKGEKIKVITKEPEESNIAIICENKDGEKFSILYKDVKILK